MPVGVRRRLRDQFGLRQPAWSTLSSWTVQQGSRTDSTDSITKGDKVEICGNSPAERERRTRVVELGGGTKAVRQP